MTADWYAKYAHRFPTYGEAAAAFRDARDGGLSPGRFKIEATPGTPCRNLLATRFEFEVTQ